jgi:uncharacterized LabA/DUF88 family protein
VVVQWLEQWLTITGLGRICLIRHGEPGGARHMLKKVLAFVDGENLVCRYQAMLGNGRTAKPDVVHVPDRFVWHRDTTRWSQLDLIRVSYYTSVTGTEQDVSALDSQISDTLFECYGSDLSATAKLLPRVHKKLKNSQKTKVVDVAITMDVMRAALTMPIDGIFLLTGDGDYLPLVRETGRSNKQVYLAAFSAGLSSSLKNNVEQFIDLDPLFFV